MANQLKTAMVNTILKLKECGWSQRKIARELNIDRETVRKYINLHKDDPSPSVDVQIDCDIPKPATNPHTGSDDENSPGPVSECEPFREIIKQKIEDGLSRQRIWQDLCTEHNFNAGYHSVRRFFNRITKDDAVPFRRMECMPGQEAQVDFGTGAPVITKDGKRKKSHVIRVVLSFSRKSYSETVFNQTTDNFIRCLENAFWHFGGVPEILIIDNLKAAVKKAHWYDPDIHPKIQSFCRHYSTVILPCKPYTPRHKDYTSSCTSLIPFGNVIATGNLSDSLTPNFCIWPS